MRSLPILKRPRCEACGTKLYRDLRIFRNSFWGPVPKYCYKCGKGISKSKKQELELYESCICIYYCIISFLLILLFICLLNP